MSLIEGEKNQPWQNDAQAVTWAHKLREALKQKKKSSAVFVVKSNVKELIHLRKSVDATRIESVLTWFCEHMGEDYCPTAGSARHFRMKFDQIERAYSTADRPEEEVSQGSKARARDLLNEHNFPIEISARLPVLVERTQKEWTLFCAKMKDKWNLLEVQSREYAFLDEIMASHWMVFVDNWFILLSNKFGRLKNYTGPVHSLAFKPSSQMFRESFWMCWSQYWSTDPHAFDDLLEGLLKENK